MLITDAFAQSALIPIALVCVIFYFLVIRPQNKRLKEQKAKLDAVRRGDEVVTGGGIIGKVAHVREDKIEVEIAPNVRVKVLKGSIGDILTKPEPISAEKK